MTKDEALKTLAIDIKACKKCKLCYTREEPTISRGDPRSPLMVVSDFPRQSDHTDKLSLSGRAGKKIDEMLIRAGMQPDKVYFTSLMKCWPGKMGYFPSDDSPGKCFGFLSQQIKIVKPLVIVLLGPEALAWVLARGTGEKPDNATDWLGRMYRRREVYEEIRFVVLPHPTVLLKAETGDLEDRCVQALALTKGFIAARQKNDIPPEIEVVDLKKLIIRDKKEQLEAFKWKKPDPPPDAPKTETPKTP